MRQQQLERVCSRVAGLTQHLTGGAKQEKESREAISVSLRSFAAAHSVNNTLFGTHTRTSSPAGTLLTSSLLFAFTEIE